MITKIAYILQDHQKRVADKLHDKPGIIAKHGLGSGKTLTMLHAAKERLDANPIGKVLFIVPASLQTNIWKEIDKHNMDIPKDRLIVKSYEKAVNDADSLKDEYIILAAVDEAHKLRNPETKRHQKLRRVLDNAEKTLLATGTPNYNKLRDIAPLVNIAKKKKELPEGPEFDDKFVSKSKPAKTFLGFTLQGEKPAQVKNQDKLKRIVNETVDIHTPGQENFPSVTHNIVRSPMSKEQYRIYQYLESELPPHLARKVRNNLPMTKQEKAQLNTFATGVRQAGTSTAPYVKSLATGPRQAGLSTEPYKEDDQIDHPKIDRAVMNLRDKQKQDKQHKSLVYSNFIDAGLRPYSQKLEQEKVPHRLFTGSLSKKEKDDIIREYNDPKSSMNTLLVSSSGGEGLDLKNVRQAQILEPHFNKSKIDQVIGRTARFRSHDDLPPEKRNVEVEHYLSTPPERSRLRNFLFGEKQTIDPYLYEMSEIKSRLGDYLFRE